MSKGGTVYFEKPGPANTKAVARAVKSRAKELGIRHVVVASNSGKTALIFHQALKGLGAEVVAVAEHAGYSGKDDSTISPEARRGLESKGIKVVVASHALSGVARSISRKFGGVSEVELIAHVLRLFGCDGIKVAVEIAVMAADAGLVPTDREIIAVGGSGRGADAALVLKAAHMNNFFDLEIREIIAKARQRKP
jgi:hypothetical protein